MGKTSEEVAQVTGYKRSWIYELVWRYNRQGAENLGDSRQTNQGAPPMLTDEQQAQLYQILSDNAPDDGLWNGRKVADYLCELLERPVSPQQGWRILKQMNFTLKVPRPSLGKSNLQQQQDWKKKLTTEVEKLQKQYPEAKLSVWSQDEHRIGLNPILRRTYVETGQQPLGSVNLETGMVMVVCLPRTRNRPNLLVDITTSQDIFV